MKQALQAAAGPSAHLVNKTKKQIVKKPAAAKRPAAIVWEGPGKPPVPKIGSPALLYKHSRIYTALSRRSFRVIVDKRNYATEKPILWKGSSPDVASWRAALKLCDDFKPKKA